jgi:hypothetical protein
VRANAKGDDGIDSMLVLRGHVESPYSMVRCIANQRLANRTARSEMQRNRELVLGDEREQFLAENHAEHV